MDHMESFLWFFWRWWCKIFARRVVFNAYNETLSWVLEFRAWIMLVFIDLFYFSFRICCFGIHFSITFVYSIACHSEGSEKIKHKIDKQHEPNQKEINIVVFYSLWSIFEDKKICQKGSFSQPVDYSFH